MSKKISKILSMTLIISIILCSVILTTSFASNNSSKKSIIKYWYPWGGDSEKWDKWRIAEFEKENPQYKVEATYVPPDAGISNGKLVAAIAGGTPPDVIVSSDYASTYSLATQGAFEPLDNVLKSINLDVKRISSVFYDLMKYKGKTYIFPMDTNVNLLYLNIDLVKQAGLDPEKPPKTIQELDTWANKLSKIENGSIKRLGFIPWIDAGDDPFMWGYMFGTNFFDVNKQKVTLTDGKMESVLKWMATYAKKYNPEKIKSFTSGFGGAFSPTHPFMTGKVALTVNGNWFTNALRIYAPKINYKVVPIPTPPGGRYGGSNLGTNVFAIPKKAKNIKGAATFMLYCEQPKIEDDNIKTWRSVSIFPDMLNDYTLVKQGDPIYKDIIKIAFNKNSGHAALTSVARMMSDDLRAIRDQIIYKNADPKALLSKEQEKLQKEVDKQSKRK